MLPIGKEKELGYYVSGPYLYDKEGRKWKHVETCKTYKVWAEMPEETSNGTQNS
jgi:hypothetical protein